MTDTQRKDAQFAQQVAVDWASEVRHMLIDGEFLPGTNAEDCMFAQEMAAQAYESARTIMGIS